MSNAKKLTPAIFGPTPNQPMVDHAIHIASLGWRVFPAPPGEKKSYKSAEHSNGRPWGATTDAVEIRRDFKWWPKANVGIVMGAISGVFVIEADTKEGHDVDGISSLAELENKHSALPNTLQAISPSGSVHYYFNHPGADFKIKNSTSGVAPGVDVRGDGGMVIAPPSVKPGKGVYAWRNELTPVADPPQWLLDIVASKIGEPASAPEHSITERAKKLVQPPAGYVDGFDEYAATGSHRGGGYIEAALLGEYDDVVRASKGERNHQLNVSSMKLGKYVAGGELNEQTVIDEMLRACTVNGLLTDDGEHQCLATIKSGLAKGKTEPKGIPERKLDQRTAEIIQLPGTTPQPGQPATAPPPIFATPYVFTDPATIRRRQWLYGNLLLRKFVRQVIPDRR